MSLSTPSSSTPSSTFSAASSSSNSNGSSGAIETGEWTKEKDAELQNSFHELLDVLAEQYQTKPGLIAMRMARMGLFTVGGHTGSGGSTSGTSGTNVSSDKKTDGPKKHNTPWLPTDVDALKKRYSLDTDKNTTIVQKMYEIAKEFERSPYSIVMKLKQLGFTEPEKEWQAQYPNSGGGGASGNYKFNSFKKRKFNNNHDDE